MFTAGYGLAAPAYVNQPPTARFNITPSTTPIGVGTTGNQTITITNLGPAAATNVVITYTPPTTAGITVNSVTSAAGACTLTASNWVCPAITSMALNATTTITVNMTVAASVPAGTTAGSNTAVNSNEFNPGNGAGESLFNIWGAYGTTAAAGNAFWFGFNGQYETYIRQYYNDGSLLLPVFNATSPNQMEEGGPLSQVWPTSQANPPGGYNLINDTTRSYYYSRPITQGGDGSNPPGASWNFYQANGATYGSANYYGYSGLNTSTNIQGFQYPYGTTSTKTTDNRPTYSQITTTPISVTLPEDPQLYWVARDNRRAWEVKTGIYLNSPSPIYICVGNVDDGMYAAIDGTQVVEQTAWDGSVKNSSGFDPVTGGNYSAGYHEITYRIVNRNNQYRSFEGGPGGFDFIGVGTLSTSDCTQQNYSTLTRVAPASDAVISAAPVPPVANADSATTSLNTPVSFNITGNDTDSDATINASTVDLDPNTAGIQTTFTVAGQGTFTVDSTGKVTFTPVTGFTGTSTIPYTVQDTQGLTSNQANITVTVQTTPVPAPTTLTISKTDGVTSVGTGRQTIYTLTIKNTGSSSTSGAITVRELLGTGLTFASATSTAGTVTGGTQGGTVEQVLTFTPTTPIAAGGTATIQVTANVTATSGNVINKATVGDGGAPAAPNPATASNCVTSTSTATTCTIDTDGVTGSTYTSDLHITKVGPATALPNDQVTYTIEVWRTTGTTGTVGGIQINDIVPSNITNVSWTCKAINSYAAQYSQCSSSAYDTSGTGNSISLTSAVLPDYNYYNNYIEITVTGNLTGAGSYTNTATTSFTGSFKDSNLNDNTASATTVATAGQPLQCQTTMFTSYGTDGNTFSSIAPTSTVGTLSSDIMTGISSTAAIGVSPDGQRMYYVPYSQANLRWYDVVNGAYKSVVFTNNTGEDVYKLAVDSKGSGYFISRNYLWTFTLDSAGTPVVTGPTALKYDVTTTNANPVPQISGNGDMFFNSAGDAFIISSPSDANGNATQGYVDIFKVRADGTALYYGRIQISQSAVVVNAVAALNGKIYASTIDRVMFELDLATLTARQTGDGPSYSSDLASCYYPDLAPNVTSVKSVAKVSGADVNGLNGTTSVIDTNSLVKAGDILEYTIVTKNTGTLNAANVTLQDTIPTGTTYVTGSTKLNYGAVADVSGAMPFATARAINSPGAGSGVLEVDTTSGTVTSNTTDPDDNEAVVTFRVKINTGTTTVNNQATIVHVDGTTNTNTVTTSTGAPALTIVKSVDNSFVTVTPDPANAGTSTLPDSQLAPTQLKYTLTVTNSGTAAASGVTVTDTLPTGLTFVSATVAKSTAANTYGTATAITNTGTGQNLSFNVGGLTAAEPGKSVQIVVTVKVSLTANTTQNALLNTAAASASSVPQVTSNQVKTDVVYPKLTKQVRNVTQNKPVNPDGTAAYSMTGADGLPGDVLEYCLNYMNYSSVALPTYKITDQVPGNTTALTSVAAYNGQAILLKRGATTTYLTAGADSDGGTLTTTGGTYGSGTLVADLDTLPAGESGQVCFRVTIK